VGHEGGREEARPDQKLTEEAPVGSAWPEKDRRWWILRWRSSRRRRPWRRFRAARGDSVDEKEDGSEEDLQGTPAELGGHPAARQSGSHGGQVGRAWGKRQRRGRGQPREDEDEGEGAGRPRGISRWSSRPPTSSRRWRGGQPCVQHVGACCLNEQDSQIAKSSLGFEVFWKH
jgi:hypothetical protein